MVVKTFPTLYSRDSKGNLMQWNIHVEGLSGEPETFAIVTEYGRIGGALQETVDVIREGKNIGKANETTPKEQALSEALSKWTKQIERKGYVEDVKVVDVDQRPGAEPMLAHRYDKHPDKIQFPCYIQPKLDGHRCIGVVDNGTAKLYSRKRVEITGLPHINAALMALAEKNGLTQVFFDGEIYNDDYRDNFEDLTGFIRSQEPKAGHEVVQYHLYDIVDTELPFEERIAHLHSLVSEADEGVLMLVETDYVQEHEVIPTFKDHLARGYEGSILRNARGAYEGKRSYNLQKVKEMQDAEFKIIGVDEGRGKMAGHAIFVCVTPEGKDFRAKMKGSMDRLEEIYANAEAYIGKEVTVQFQGFTNDGIPRFPVALRIREDV